MKKIMLIKYFKKYSFIIIEIQSIIEKKKIIILKLKF